MTVQVSANVNYIDISKISSDSKLIVAFNFVKDNTKYYDHWTTDWSYDKPKENLIKQLRDYFKDFSALTTKNEETYLLLGDIAHYLYNMDDTTYYSIAVKNYDAAVKSNPADYRCYWFLGFHYALSNVPTLAIDNLMKAEKLLPPEQPADFWNDYALATAVTNMPSHCIYAMDKVKSISGKEGSFQQQLGETIYKRIIPMDKNETYKKEDVWTASQGDKITFTSRPLGIKILVDSTWDLQIYDYQKNQGVFIITPPTIANKKGKEIHYSNLLSLIRNENLMFIGVENGYAKFLNEKNIQETPVKFFIDKVKESIENYTEWTKTLSQILVSFEKDMNKNG